MEEMEYGDDFTEKMLSEFPITEKSREMLKAGTIWQIVGFSARKEDIEFHANIYQISYEAVMRWKRYWQDLYIKAKRNKAEL